MKRNNFLFLFLTVFISISTIFSFNISEYEYVSYVNVYCEEYIGYVKLELPQEYLLLDSPSLYMDEEYVLENSQGGTFFSKNTHWYIKQIDSFEISEVEKIFDGDYATNLIAENKDTIGFLFENPNLQKVQKISFDLKDSSLNVIKIFNNGVELDYELNKNNFRYEVYFNTPILSNSLEFQLTYDDVLKIKEISFFEEKSYLEKSFLYFYIDNTCNKDFKFYFGDYGEDNSQYGSKELKIYFDTDVFTNSNTQYNSDFDSDSILNKDDNCLYVPNINQKDINYNTVGEACEDDDGDRILNFYDNCIDDYNPNQLDDDNDLIGNFCDLEDERFFEENKFIIYILGIIIGMVFLFISFKLIKKS